MRVFVVEASGKGGMIHYDYHLCRALQQLGVETTLVTSTAYELRALPHNFHVAEQLRLWDPRGAKATNPLWSKIRRALRGVQYVWEWLRLIWFLRRERPDVVLFGEIRFGFELHFLRLLRRLGLRLADVVHDVRVYDTQRDSDVIVQESQTQIALYNRIYHQFDALFVHDRSNYDDFMDLYDVPAERVHEIPMGTNEIVLETPPSHTPYELCAELGLDPDHPVVLFFGTITKYKGVEDLIRAFALVLADCPTAQLLIAGFPAKDVSPESLHKLAAEQGVSSQVTWFLDYVPNEQVAPLMALSRVVVLPYRAITQSAVIQIAYACGRPVVATRVGGLPDVVEEGASGLLAEPEDPVSLAAAITQIVSDQAASERMGEHAQLLADTRYSWQNVASRVRTALEALL